jgi:hypothetical protein
MTGPLNTQLIQTEIPIQLKLKWQVPLNIQLIQTEMTGPLNTQLIQTKMTGPFKYSANSNWNDRSL